MKISHLKLQITKIIMTDIIDGPVDTFAIEKLILDKIAKSKRRMLIAMGVITDPTPVDIAVAMSGIHPLSDTRRDDIIQQLCEIMPAKEKSVDLKTILWEHFLNENKRAITRDYYSTIEPDGTKMAIDCLANNVYYTRAGNFTSLDLLFASPIIDVLEQAFHSVFFRVYMGFGNDPAETVLLSYADYTTFSVDEIGYIDALPHYCGGVYFCKQI